MHKKDMFHPKKYMYFFLTMKTIKKKKKNLGLQQRQCL